jgi:hypothetical protein
MAFWQDAVRDLALTLHQGAADQRRLQAVRGPVPLCSSACAGACCLAAGRARCAAACACAPADPAPPVLRPHTRCPPPRAAPRHPIPRQGARRLTMRLCSVFLFQPEVAIQLCCMDLETGETGEPEAGLWDRTAAALGLSEAQVGSRVGAGTRGAGRGAGGVGRPREAAPCYRARGGPRHAAGPGPGATRRPRRCGCGRPQLYRRAPAASGPLTWNLTPRRAAPHRAAPRRTLPQAATMSIMHQFWQQASAALQERRAALAQRGLEAPGDLELQESLLEGLEHAQATFPVRHAPGHGGGGRGVCAAGFVLVDSTQRAHPTARIRPDLHPPPPHPTPPRSTPHHPTPAPRPARSWLLLSSAS